MCLAINFRTPDYHSHTENLYINSKASMQICTFGTTVDDKRLAPSDANTLLVQSTLDM